MIKKRLLLIGTLALTCTAAGWADDGHTFPEEGKVYVLHRFSNENAYMYEKSGMLYAGALDKTQRQYWQFVPTENPNRYYIQNVTSGRYVQTSNLAIVNGAGTQVSVGAEPVEFEIKASTTGATQGYYYLCSTDQTTISNSGDVTKGLNFGASGIVVGYWIATGRANSYWEILEHAYDYEAPQPVEVARTDFAKRLGVYYLPCGEQGTAYLSSLTVEGTSEEVTNGLQYTASARPSSFYNYVRNDSAEVVQGGKFTLAFSAQGTGTDDVATAWFDWDKDGVFETEQTFADAGAGSAEINVPAEAQTGKVRMRFRLNNNELNGADDEVNGQIYDFMLYVHKKDAQTGIDAAPSRREDTATGAAYSLDGKRVKLDTHQGVYIQQGQKKIK